ncbi:MAG TPA: protein kinase [Bryobacterales bacterium]|nr:protein kinase [Bryobacterales bacterium]
MAAAQRSLPRIDTFDFQPGRILARKYEVLSRLGSGWEGEVYLVRERTTGIERAIKVFYPHRNPKDRAITFYARKLHHLRHCGMLIQYHTEETMQFKRTPIKLLVSEYFEGDVLELFIKRQPGRRLTPFVAVHLLHSLARGIESIHRHREYHGDLHSGNIILRRSGLGFDIKLIDFFYWRLPRRERLQNDICDLIRIFYDALGGQKRYASHRPEIKYICCGLRRTLILKKFPTVTALREHLEVMSWS